MTMSNKSGAVTLAEGAPRYKVDVNVTFGGEHANKSFVLRTTYDSYPVWKTKHAVSTSPFKLKGVSEQKFAAIINNEAWVYSIDGTKQNDIFHAVKMGMHWYGVSAKTLLENIYVKNLNSELEHQSGATGSALVEANKELYKSTCQAILGAARLLGVSSSLNFWVFSNKVNPKISLSHLQEALKSGGANSIKSDTAYKFRFKVQSNDGTTTENYFTHLHLATLKP